MERSEKKLASSMTMQVAASMLLIAVFGGCASLPGKTTAAGEGVVPTEKRLVRGDTLKNFSPLPSVTSIAVLQSFSDGHQERHPGFVEYDFNRDGRPDMLEILSPEGQPAAYAYDFDFDGKIDGIERVEAVQKKNQSPR
jgi:hypothetical protein